MKKIFIFIIISISLLYILKLTTAKKEKKGREIEVLIVDTKFEEDNGIKNGYTSLLEEEGIPFKWVSPAFILSKIPEEAVKYHPAIIFPDKLSGVLTDEIGQWCLEYVKKGGSVIVIFDAGVYYKNKRYRKNPVFSRIIGLNYCSYKKYRKNLYFNGNLKFISEKVANEFGIPEGRLIDKLFICGYKYGKLIYPFLRCENLKIQSNFDIYAYGIDKKGRKFPAIIKVKKGKGKVFYINLPLGYLKSYGSEDLLPRTILRTLLFKFTSLPHLLSAPYGKGGIVINWHIDNNTEWKATPNLIKNKIIRDTLKYSFHITAGDFVDKPGDGYGFDASGKGKEYVLLMSKYGIIGSHGGWAHNWFAKNLEEGKFTEKEIEYYILKNTEVLEKIVGYKIVEYSAPDGTHPQPLLTKILEKNGFICYYYTGDIGSVPNRTFYNGKIVSKKVIAFPVMPNGKYASLAEMGWVNLPPQRIKKWLFSIVNCSVKNRTVHLYYTHPYDLLDFPRYIPPLKDFIDYIEKLKSEGKIIVEPMNYFAKFLLRFLKTKYSFVIYNDDLKINLKNEQGLKGICIALPEEYIIKPIEGISIEKGSKYNYLTILKDIKEKTITVKINQ